MGEIVVVLFIAYVIFMFVGFVFFRHIDHRGSHHPPLWIPQRPKPCCMCGSEAVITKVDKDYYEIRCGNKNCSSEPQVGTTRTYAKWYWNFANAQPPKKGR